MGPTEPLLAVVRRGYVRVAPGRVTRIKSDWQTGKLRVEARDAKGGASLLIWTPTGAAEQPLAASGVVDLAGHEVSGGRWVTGTVAADGDWVVSVGGP